MPSDGTAGIGPTDPLAPGPLLTLAGDGLDVEIAPEAGGRIARIRCDGIEQLVGHGDHDSVAAISWGSYPMVPWCGRIRDGRFVFDGQAYELPRNLGGHAIHGVGYLLPWRVSEHSPRHAVLELELPSDARWPFGGEARQKIALEGRRLVMELSVTAGARAMPATLGWHPWFLKPERLEFRPEAMYPRDAGNITLAAGRGASRAVGRLLRQPRAGGGPARRPAHRPGLGLQRLGGLRRTGLRHLHRTADRAAGRLQPVAGLPAGTGADPLRDVHDGVGLSNRASFLRERPAIPKRRGAVPAGGK